jgi:Holliday junction DNA helicase RuvA
MYEYLIGTIIEKKNNEVIIENNKIGYSVNCSYNTISALPGIGEETKLYIYEDIKEDAYKLFGFYQNDERDAFIKIISVSGIGTKVGISLLSQFSFQQLVSHVQNEETGLLSQTPGIGKKTANRLILELKDKFNFNFATKNFAEQTDIPKLHTITIDEAIDALLSLGFKEKDVRKIIGEIYEDGMTVEEIIGQVLSRIGRS